MTSTLPVLPRFRQQLVKSRYVQAHILHNMDNDKTNNELVREIAQIVLGMDEAVSHNQ
jgi:hypothetical protein